MKIYLTRDGSVETSLWREFSSLGHQVNRFRSRTAEGWFNFFEKRIADLVLVTNNCQREPLLEGLKQTVKRPMCIYWERRHPKFILEKDYKYFDKIFTVYNDGSAELLPCAADDHFFLKKNNNYGVTLIAKDKRTQIDNPFRQCRINLHAKIDQDIGIAQYRLFNRIKPYDKRFEIMANSLMSIGIWNNNLAVPLRYFEIISCCTLLLSYPYSEFRNYFEPKKHYVETHNLKKAIAYYKKYPKIALKIAQEGYKHFLNNHTYTHRVKQLLSSIGV